MMKLPLNKILYGNCITLMQTLPNHSIDLIFADPPYNLQINDTLKRPDDSEVKGVHDDWDQFDSFEAYDLFTHNWLSEARRILKPNGALWVIGSYHNIFRVGAILQDHDFWIQNDIIWRKTNPMPNFKGTRFANAHETLIWAGRSEKSRPSFNYQAMKMINDGIQMRSDWTLPICSGAERLKLQNGEKAHSTQKPEALLYRVILSTSEPEHIILDPFFGTGTTGVVAKKLGRYFIGIEQNADYVTLAENRIKTVKELDKQALSITPDKRQQSRVPFGFLIEKGFISPGEQLYSPNAKYSAKVHSDGSLSSQNTRGSIHQIGAYLTHAPSCNGWTFWHIRKTNNHFIPIDQLRQKARTELVN